MSFGSAGLADCTDVPLCKKYFAWGWRGSVSRKKIHKFAHVQKPCSAVKMDYHNNADLTP
jgi:hypothetical protein